MNRNAAADRRKAENLVAEDRIAAFGQFVLDIAQRLVDNQRVVALDAHLRNRHLADRSFVETVGQIARQHFLDDGQHDLLLRDLAVQFGSRLQLVVFAKHHDGVVHRDRELPVLDLALELLAAETGRLSLVRAYRP